MDSSASKTLRNKYLFFKPPNSWYFCYSSLNNLKHWGRRKRNMRILSLSWPPFHETVVNIMGHFEKSYDVALKVFKWRD